MPTCMEPVSGQISCDLAAAKERVFREDPINLVHQFQCLSFHTDRRIVKRRPANLKQLALLGQAQVCAVSVDQRLAFGRAYRFSPCDKKSFSTVSFPILA